MRRIIAALLMMILAFSAASVQAEDFLLGVEPEPSDITPAYRSTETPEGHEGCYWCTPMDIIDEKAVWAMLTSPMTVADIDMNKQTVVYAEPDENSEVLYQAEDGTELLIAGEIGEWLILADNAGFVSVLNVRWEQGTAPVKTEPAKEADKETAPEAVPAASEGTEEVLPESGSEPAAETEPAEEQTPVEETRPAEENTVVEETSPAEENTAAEENEPAEETKAEDAVDETIPESGSEETEPAGEAAEQPEGGEAAEEVQPEEEPVHTDPNKIVRITSTRRKTMQEGEMVYLMSELIGFENSSEIVYIWKVDKGNGFEVIPGENGPIYAFPATTETLSWDYTLTVLSR